MSGYEIGYKIGEAIASALPYLIAGLVVVAFFVVCWAAFRLLSRHGL